jgi:DNA-binding SARP family transcriptional activator/tetratricopeptide (TPR) repeat protein
MRYQVLGPVELLGAQGRLGGPKQRAVLALLLLNANRVVSEQRFVSVVWGDEPPPSVRGQLQMYVSQLRKLIGEPVIVRRPPGYLIQVRPGELDLDVFDEQVRQARAALVAGQTVDAVEAFRSALALWQGTALGGVTEPLLERDGPVLRDRRLTVLEEYFDAGLAAGQHDRLLRELRAAAEEYPLRERVQAQLMLALHRSGRTAEALEVYTVTRARLVAERGVEPGQLLRETQAGLLNEEDRAPETVAPRQLPGDMPVFAGRAAELARLDALLPAPVVVIGGSAGIGKTTLAVRWAHRIKERFPDGQLYANLRGYDPCQNKAAPDDLVRGFLEALGVPVTGIPADAQARFSLYRSLLAGKRVLVVLDNARDAEQVRPLLPGAPGCLTVVTSRDQLPSLIAADGAAPVTLGLLPEREALDVLARRLGADRVEAEPAAVARLVALCARLPLALAIVAARAATHPGFSLAALTDELAAIGGLDAFDAGDPAANVRAVFSWSYRTLSPRAARLFRLLGLHPGPHVTVAAAASMLGEPVPAARSPLAELTRAHLLTEPRPGRYGCHDLLRTYAGELAETEDPSPERRAAIERLLDHYLHTAYVTDRFLRRHMAPDPVPVPPGVTVADIRTEQQAVSWYGAEYEVLGAAVELAVRTGLDTHAWPLACALTSTFWHGGARWLGGPEVYESALAAAARLADPLAQALALRSRAVFRLTQQRLDEAEDDLVTALRLLDQGDELDQRADLHQKLAWVCGQRRDYVGELRHAETALKLYRATGNRGGVAVSYNNVAWSLAHLGDHERAVILCEKALTILAEIEDRKSEAATWDTLGFANADLGHYDEAITCYQQAIELHRKVDSKVNLARTHERIGDIHLTRDATTEAREAWEQALALFEELVLPDRAEKVRVRLARLAALAELDPKH